MRWWNDINGVGLPYENTGFLGMVSHIMDSSAWHLFLTLRQLRPKRIESPALHILRSEIGLFLT
jgi:hypothetical protein